MISIIVPVYNAERFLEATLASVLAQSLSEWELLVVDDGSKDASVSVAQSFALRDARVRVFAKENGGCGAARNFGVEKARPDSEYIIFLDHDDVWEPHALEALHKAASGLPRCVGAVGAAGVLRGDQKEEPPHSGLQTESAGTLTFTDLVVFNHISTMGQVLIRRSALTAAGPLDPQSAPVDDWDIYLRLALQGSFATTSATVIYWRSHENNTSKNIALMRQAEDYVRNKLLNLPDLTDTQRRYVRSSFGNMARALSSLQIKWARESLGRKNWGEAARQTGRAAANYARSFGRKQTS